MAHIVIVKSIMLVMKYQKKGISKTIRGRAIKFCDNTSDFKLLSIITLK